MRLLIYFDGQFWTGLIESQAGREYFAHRYVFGVEPTDAEVLEFVNTKLLSLLISPKLQAPTSEPDMHRSINPKRLKRLAAKELKQNPVSTKSQEAIQLKLEEQKVERRITSKANREANRQKQRAIAREKAKQKHRGR